MWTLSKQIRFESSHQLDQHDGKCSRLHGHSWVAVIKVSGPDLHRSGPQTGMLYDYGRLKNILRPIEEKLDHHHLNDAIPYYPTSENVARWIGMMVMEGLSTDEDAAGVSLVSVTVHETCTSECTWVPPMQVGLPRR